MGLVSAFDAISVNTRTLPNGQHAGYTTGGGYIEWATSQWSADPGALRICQDPVGSDSTADVFDVESGGGLVSEVVGWAKRAYAAYIAGIRPGQRMPCVYSAGGTLTGIANAIAAAKLPFVVHLWLAEPGISLAEAQAKVLSSQTGVLPMAGLQYAWPGYGLPSNGTYDESTFTDAWLTTQSGHVGSTVSIGNSGPAVVAAQRLLRARDSALAVTADGLFGPGTQTAVETFQKLKGLKPDGVVGPATWAVLAGPPGVPPPPVKPPVPPVKPPPTPPPAKPSPAPSRTHTAIVSAGSHVTLSWTPVGFARGYHVQIEKVPSNAVILDTSVTSLAYTKLLEPKTKYRWRVATTDDPHTWTAWVGFETP
jgi:hypothetical protein